jgi:hypothetical protein
MRTVHYLGDLERDLTTPMATVVAQKYRLFSLSVIERVDVRSVDNGDHMPAGKHISLTCG